ncbi:MAG: MinD/ParA family protein [Spirochaetaceae bacterium]|nr:MAG: MinD/ParA family protein [Spirochaetaceae bacterium]
MRVIPIASGKGGVGKSLLAANLAIALAKNDRSVTLVDLDLGGSNLHLVLGETMSYGGDGPAGIGSLIADSSCTVNDIGRPTEYEGLTFIAGDGETPGLANLQSSAKRRIIRQLGQAESDYMILDLGAGTSYNTLDFFLMTSQGLVVTTPTPTSTVNAYLFLKNAVFRIMQNAMPRKSPGGQLVESLRSEPTGMRGTYIPRLLDELKKTDPDSHGRCLEQLSRFRPRLVMNMLEDPKDSEKAGRLRRSCRQYLGLELEHLGIMYRDDLQDVALSSRLPIIHYKPQSVLSQAVYRIADKLISTETDDAESFNLAGAEESYQEASMEAESDFAARTDYVEDLLHTGALSTGDLIETVKMQQIELNQMRKENNLLKAKLVRAIKQGYTL